ncbi:MAG: PepSY domain-containing protein [Caulobacter sp.]|nr:PepSY domain-containing protein [Caulobacter sp.]
MNRFAAILFAALIGAATPAAAAAQSCPQGAAGKTCRDTARISGDAFFQTIQMRRGGNSLGDSWAPREDDARDGVRGGRLVPLEQVIRNIARSTPGRLLDAGLENRGDRPIYRVRWQADNGQRIDFIVDASTGAIIGRN